MKKKALLRINVLLGAASLALAGCHSSKPVPQTPKDKNPSDTTNVQPVVKPDHEVFVKYGIPPTFNMYE